MKKPLSIIQEAEAVPVGTDLYEHKYTFEQVEKIIKSAIESGLFCETECDLCGDTITKYKMDLESADCVSILIDSKLKWKKVCGDCARAIAKTLIDEA